MYFNPLPHNPSFYRPWVRRLLKKNVGKGENAGSQRFVLFPVITSSVSQTFHNQAIQ